jgi:hypothetical protein
MQVTMQALGGVRAKPGQRPEEPNLIEVLADASLIGNEVTLLPRPDPAPARRRMQVPCARNRRRTRPDERRRHAAARVCAVLVIN